MLEHLWKKFNPGNDVGPEIESSPYVNVEGLSRKISVPDPTRDDKRWARRLKNATTGDITTALISAIETGNNWRVWYLINRPARKVRQWLGGIKSFGFGGETEIEKGMSKAAEHDNVTAAYLLLKFAEKNYASEKLPVKAAPEACGDEACHYARRTVLDAAAKPGSDVFALVAQSALKKQPVPDDISLLKHAALRAAAQGNHGHLDAMLDNKLLSSRQCVDAFMESFSCDKLRDGKDFMPLARRDFLGWMQKRGIVDETFVDEAAAVEVRVAAQKASYRAAREKGWTESRRLLKTDDAQGRGPLVADAEITLGGQKPVTYAFNFAAGRADKIQGPVVQSAAFDQLKDTSLVEEARAFVESCLPATPELVWKKGEPFRLRLKQQTL